MSGLRGLNRKRTLVRPPPPKKKKQHQKFRGAGPSHPHPPCTKKCKTLSQKGDLEGPLKPWLLRPAPQLCPAPDTASGAVGPWARRPSQVARGRPGLRQDFVIMQAPTGTAPGAPTPAQDFHLPLPTPARGSEPVRGPRGWLGG